MDEEDAGTRLERIDPAHVDAADEDDDDLLTSPAYPNRRKNVRPYCCTCPSRRGWLFICLFVMLLLVVVTIVWAVGEMMVKDTLYTQADWLTWEQVQAQGFSVDNDTLILVDIPMTHTDKITDALAAYEHITSDGFRRPVFVNQTIADTTYRTRAACANYGTANYVLHPRNFECRELYYTTRMAQRCMSRLACNEFRPVIGFGFVLRNPILRFIDEFEGKYGGWPQDNEHPVLADDMLLDEDFYCNGTQRTNQPTCADQFTDEGGYGPPNSPHRYLHLDAYLACKDNPAANRMARTIAGSVLRHTDQFIGNPTTLLEEAKKAVDASLWFGDAKDLPGSLVLLERIMHTPFETDVSIEERGIPSYITPEQLRRIQFLNAIDMELYAYASEVYRKRIDDAHLNA